MMKLSLDWLSDFVAFTEKDPQKIAEALTLSVAEVEEVEEQGTLLKHCVVGKVESIAKHPNADKLSLCMVLTDQGKKKVVCGGTNLRQGMLVAFAHVGASVKWHGGELMQLTKTKIRGEESEGMICASSELDLTSRFPSAEDRTIVDLGDGGYTIGQSLKEAFGLDDVVFHIDNHAITNRADLFSHIGFARECVAIGLGKWNPAFAPRSGATGGKEKSKVKFGTGVIPFKFSVDEPKLMPRYLSALIEIDGIGETPAWMKKRLEAVGWRSLSLPIDITNYVATEIGVPLHSFDADDIVGTVHMRTSKKGEKIVTLDHQERELPAGGLVLSDDKGIFDLLGIMGGLRSSTKASTKRIYLHSATLDPLSIRRTIIATGHRTDAATIYEKGVPPVTAEQGFYRAAQLMLELIPGARISSKLESKGENGKPKPIKLSLERASSLLGQLILSKEASGILTDLGCKVAGKGNVLTVTSPLNRIGDLKAPVDLIEEIARVAGFRSFEEELPTASIRPPQRNFKENKVRDVLKEAGFMELVQFTFIGEEILRKAGLPVKEGALREIENPIGEDMKYMRPTLLPHLLSFAEENMQYAEETLSVFEIGNVFSAKKETKHLALLVASTRKGGVQSEPFLLAKSAVREILDALNATSSFQKMKSGLPMEHPARAACILAGGKDIGALFEIHPSVAKNFSLLGRAAAVVIDFDSLISHPSGEKIYKDVPSFPSIAYDTTVVFPQEKEVGPLLEKVRGFSALLQEIEVIDVYHKGSERRLTFRCTYNAGDRTLKEEEVKPVQEKVEALLRAS